MSRTTRLTMAQALVRYLCRQFTIIDGQQVHLFAGLFGIFGHGNVTCLGEALAEVQAQLPTWRGQNEQSMTLAAIAFAKAKRRRQMMIAAASIGPGAANMVTAAAVAHANRLPVLLLAADVFANRRPDPVLQQLEHFGNPTVTVNDAFKAVTRYWDRLTHPEQIISSLPQAVATLLDPGDCGPVFIGMCQDTQEQAFDYPDRFFAPVIHHIAKPRPSREQIAAAARRLTTAKRPLIISGGGVRYAGAETVLAEFALARGIPIAETIAGKGTLRHDHAALVGSLGVIGSSAANAVAAEADVILAIGTRLQDFTTGSWTCFGPEAEFISINTSRWDATKHAAIAVVGDALVALQELEDTLAEWSPDRQWLARGQAAFSAWNATLDAHQQPDDGPLPSYAQIIAVVNRYAGRHDPIVVAAGGLPGEAVKNWRVKSPHSFDGEFGFSCMGYEIAGGWGHAMAAPPGVTPIVLVGDGAYLMMNSDIYSSVISGHKMIIVLCNNGGFAVIDRLQNAKGGRSFNNLIADSQVQTMRNVNFVKHAEAMGALARKVTSLSALEAALYWAGGTARTTVIVIDSDPHAWTPGDADWDVGVPEVSGRQEVRQARAAQEAIRKKQRIGV